MNWTMDRIEEGKRLLDQLLASPKVPFDRSLRGRLPEAHGIYAISARQAPDGKVLRAGRSKSAAGGLQQAIYQNQFMGSQKGNLTAQLVDGGQCANHEDAKKWVRENCFVQFIVVPDADQRQWLKHFILAVLRPEYCD